MTKELSGESVSGEEEFCAEAGGVVREDEPRTEPPVYDLEERTARFGEAVIEFAKKFPRGPLTNRLIEQIVGCSSSIGANYCEADDAVSKKSVLPSHRHVPKGSARDQAFPTDDCLCGARVETPGADSLAGGEGTEPHFRQNLQEQRREMPKSDARNNDENQMTKGSRTRSFSSFGFRHCFGFHHSGFVIFNS